MEICIRNILANLANVQEDLLSLSDDIWLDIDHNDSEAVRKGAEFKVEYNTVMERFTGAAGDLSRLIQDFTQVSGVLPEVDEQIAQSVAERAQNERIIHELDSSIPHSLEEDFRYKRPFGFKLEDKVYPNFVAWQHIYEGVSKHLSKKNHRLFD